MIFMVNIDKWIGIFSESSVYYVVLGVVFVYFDRDLCCVWK